VCCFKGFDDESFSFNIQATLDLFARQFDLFSRLLAKGLDLYAYTTFTSPTADGVPTAMRTFVDRLQRISEALPLRTVPLEISFPHRMTRVKHAKAQVSSGGSGI